MPTDKTISRGLFPCGTPIYFELCTSPPSHQSIKKRSMSIHITLLKFQVGTKFQCPQTKPSPDGYSHLEHQFLFVLCTSPPLYQSIKTKSRSIPFALPRFLVGTKFECRQTKPSPEGYSHKERQFFLRYAHLLFHTNLSNQEVGQYLLRLFNFGWGQNLNADRQNHLPRAILTRSAKFVRAMHISFFIPIY